MTLKKCTGCGSQFEGDMKFCAKCGAKLEGVDTTVPDNNETDRIETAQSSGADENKVIPPMNSGVKPGRGRVIKLDGKTAMIGMTDGSVLEVPCTDLGFKANLNDEIDIFVNNGNTIYAKAAPPKENVIVVESDKKASKLIYFLLAFFLGAAGIHNFYSGNTVIGIIWLIVFGICFLLCLTGIGAFIGLPVIGALELIALIQAIIYVLK